MNRLIATLCLGVTLSLPVAARADDAADRVAAATNLVNKTLIKNLQTGFNVALEKTVAPMPEARAEAVRKELLDEFEKQRALMVQGLSKDYAEKFSLAELKQTGVTMLLVEQNMAVALDLADRAYVLRTGEVSLEGPAAELKDNYEEVAAAYLGARR